MTRNQQPAARRSLYDITGNTSDTNTLLITQIELNGLHDELENLRAKLKTYEDLGGAADDVQLLRMGYAAARLEIEALRAALASAAAPAEQPAKPSPTAGMSIAQRILHVGGRNNAAGYVEFGSTQAVEALVRQVLRDLQAPQPGTAYAALPDDLESFKTYLKECDECAIVPDVAGAFNAAWQIASHGQAPAQPVATAGVSLARIIEEKIAAMTPSEASAFMVARAELAASGNDQAAPDMRDPYGGAREDLAIWRKRALEAEALNRKFATSVNGPTFMGEPADSDGALMAREIHESQDDSLLLCASDLQHSAIYDNHVEMQSCMRAVAARIAALVHAAPKAEPAAPAAVAGQSMSADEVNALPTAARAYIHQLATNTDPAGMVRENMQLRDTNAGLQSMYRKAADAAQEVVGCFHAAECEGLQAALTGTADEHLKDLVERRLMHALYAAQEVAGQAPAQAAPAAVAGASEAVAYLDIGAGGYLDLGTDLTDEALSHLPKGRHALVIAGTYGIDGYIAAPTTQPAPREELAKRLIGEVLEADAIATIVCRGVAELPDRDSPDDWPEAMLVTADELHQIVREAVIAAQPAPQQEAQEPVAVIGAGFTIFWAGHGPIAPIVERHALKVGSPLYAAPQPAPAAQGDALDAARWRALLACGRIRIIGTAGVTGTGAHDPKALDPNKQPYGNYVHFGAEFWSTFPDQDYYNTKENPAYARATLTEFADAARAAQEGKTP